jgi:4-hydroxymandelate oxidase
MAHDGVAGSVALTAPDLQSLAEVYDAACQTLDDGAWAYLDAGAGTGATLSANRSAFASWDLLPSPLSGVTAVDTNCHFLGLALKTPILTGPVGTYSAFHPEGDLAVARAAQRFGTAAIVPVLSSFTLEETAAAAPSAARVLQLLASGSIEIAISLVARARDAGYKAICLTVDAYPRGIRDRITRSRFDLPLEAVSANYSGESTPELVRHMDLGESAWSWRTLRDLVEASELPIIVKGVLTPGVARAAVEAGASAVMVSNVGGRQLDGAPGALSQLPAIVAEIGADAEIAFDSGIRRGTDVLKALALGANVVSLGRASAMGLAAAGEEGVLAVLRLLTEELTTVMALCGVARLGQLDSRLLQASYLSRV